MKRAGLYARVSTPGQEIEQTIESQLAEVKARIKEDGNQLLEECIYVDDGWSGDILERPDLDRMRDDAKDGIFEVMYFYDRGRVSRKYVYQEIVIEELEKEKIEIISLHDVKADTPEDKMAQGVMGIFHEYEKVKIAERFRRGKLYKVRNGKLLGYTPPYGYDYHPRIKKGLEAQDGHFTVNKKEAQVVQMIFKWVGEDCVSLREVIRLLYKLDIKPRKQKRDTWTKGPVIRLLQSESYIGNHYYNKTESIIPKYRKDDNKKYRRVLKTSRKQRPKEDWVMVEIPAIIDNELFHKVQAQLSLNKKYSRRNNSKNDYLLTSLIYCSCGKTRTGEGVNGHTYYRCTDRLARFPLPRICTEGGVSVQILDNIVWKQLELLLSSPKLIQRQAERWMKANTQDRYKTIAHSIKSDFGELEIEEGRYTKAYGEGIMSDSVYRERMQSIKARRKLLKQRQTESDKKIATIAPVDAQILANSVVGTIEKLAFDEKKSIVRKLITKVTVTQKEALVWGQIPVTSEAKVGLSAEYRNCRIA